MRQDILFQYNPWWEGTYRIPPQVIDRPEIINKIEQAMDDPSILLLTGLRRIGKTTLMKLMISRLIVRGVDAKHIFYVSLDDYVLADKSIMELVEDFRKTQRLPIDQKVYLFLDEVAAKENYQLQLKNLHDREHAKVIASSSSSSALRDSKARLTGRERVLEILPLDFQEYQRFKNISLKKKDEALQASYFEEYLRTGGIPEYVLSGNREYLQNLVDDVITKDIISFHGLKNRRQVRDCFLLLMESAGSPVSITRMANILKISPDTAARFLNLFVEAYLVYLVPRFGKTAEKLLAPKKIYAADLGVRCAFNLKPNLGKLFENYVFLQTKQYEPYYVYEAGTEIDLLYPDGTLVEVKYGEELQGKQLRFFETFKAKQRLVVNNLSDIKELIDILKR